MDKLKDFEKQNAAYREKFGDINSASPPVTAVNAPNLSEQPYPQQNIQAQNQTPSQPTKPRYFTADDAKQIDDEIAKTTK